MKAPDDTAVWKALADPTRRRILDHLSERERTTGELALLFPSITRIAVMKHLSVLEAADLVKVRRAGRNRWNHINPIPLQRIHERWLSRHVSSVALRLLRLERLATSGSRRKE